MYVHVTRFREMCDLHDNTVTVYWPGGSAMGTWPSYTYYEGIHDNVNKKDRRGSYQASSVQHSRHEVALTPFTTGYLGLGGAPYNHVPPLPMPIIPDDVNALVPVVSDGLWEDFCLRAFNSFSTQIPTDVGIANFTWELREIGELLPRLQDSLLKSAAGGFLNYSFGWKPFLGDLKKLANLSNTVDAKVNHLIATYGKKTRLSLVEPKLFDDVILIPQLSISGGNSNSYLGLVGHRASFRASGRLYHELQGLRTLSGTIRAFISALGLNNPVKAVWDAIPYSFVAGWFTRVGTHLDTLAINPFKGQWRVDNLTFTLEQWAVIEGYRWTTYGYALSQVYAGRVDVKRYTRIAGFPIGLNSFNLFELNPSQLTLLGSLTVGI